jgi:hypothetical protein
MKEQSLAEAKFQKAKGKAPASGGDDQDDELSRAMEKSIKTGQSGGGGLLQVTWRNGGCIRGSPFTVILCGFMILSHLNTFVSGKEQFSRDLLVTQVETMAFGFLRFIYLVITYVNSMMAFGSLNWCAFSGCNLAIVCKWLVVWQSLILAAKHPRLPCHSFFVRK